MRHSVYPQNRYTNTGCLPILESLTLKFNFSVIFDPMKLSLGWDEDIDLEKGPN